MSSSLESELTEVRSWQIFSWMLKMLSLKKLKKWILVKGMVDPVVRCLSVRLAAMLTRKPEQFFLFSSIHLEFWAVLALHSAFLYVFRLSFQAEWESSTLVEHHFLSSYCHVCFNFWVSELNQWANLFCFISFLLRGAAEARALAGTAAWNLLLAQSGNYWETTFFMRLVILCDWVELINLE